MLLQGYCFQINIILKQICGVSLVYIVTLFNLCFGENKYCDGRSSN